MQLLDEIAAVLGGRSQKAAGVLAVSGGPDSVALALASQQLHRAGRLGQHGRLVIAHVNHLLRGPDSDADEAFVVHQGDALGLEVRTVRRDTLAETARTGANLEDAARRLRYEWLAQVAREVGASWVATGHTADDQAETVLHRLLRGSGLHGLSGMAVARPLDGPVLLLRPLLRVRRSDVLAFLEGQGRDFRADASNLDPRFTRNRLRHEVLPLLAVANPDVTGALNRLAEQAREAQEVIDRLAARLLAEAELPRAGALIVLRADALAGEPPLVVREGLRALWRREGWPQADMTFDAWEKAAGVALGEIKAWDLPGGLHVRHAGRVIQVGPRA